MTQQCIKPASSCCWSRGGWRLPLIKCLKSEKGDKDAGLMRLGTQFYLCGGGEVPPVLERSWAERILLQDEKQRCDRVGGCSAEDRTSEREREELTSYITTSWEALRRIGSMLDLEFKTADHLLRFCCFTKSVDMRGDDVREILRFTVENFYLVWYKTVEYSLSIIRSCICFTIIYVTRSTNVTHNKSSQIIATQCLSGKLPRCGSPCQIFIWLSYPATKSGLHQQS